MAQSPPRLGEEVPTALQPARSLAPPPLGGEVPEHLQPVRPSMNTATVNGQPVPGSTFGEKVANAAALIGRGVTDALPTAGGLVGGLVGGVPGAVAGGMAGEGFKQIVRHGAELPGAVADVARNLVTQPNATLQGFAQGAETGGRAATKEGLEQGAAQVLGEGVVKAGGVMAKWLMNRATTRVSAKLMQDFPELSDTLIDHALTVSQGGYEKARRLLFAAKHEATTALKTADASGATIPVEMNADLAESLKTAVLEKLVKSGKVPVTPNTPLTIASKRVDPATKQLFATIDQAAAQGGQLDLLPTHADLLKTQLQKESRALYANRTAPNGPKAIGMDATERADFATQLNSAIDAVATGYKAGNAAAQPLIGAVRGIKQAIRPSGNLYQAMVRPAVGAVLGEEAGRRTGLNPIASGVAGAALTSPAGMSREAILLAHPVMQSILRQLPRASALALTELLGQSAPTALPADSSRPTGGSR